MSDLSVADFCRLANQNRAEAAKAGEAALRRIVSGQAPPEPYDAVLGGVACDMDGDRLSLSLRPQGRMLELILRFERGGGILISDVLMVEPASTEALSAFIGRGVASIRQEMTHAATLNEPYSKPAALVLRWLAGEEMSR